MVLRARIARHVRVLYWGSNKGCRNPPKSPHFASRRGSPLFTLFQRKKVLISLRWAKRARGGRYLPYPAYLLVFDFYSPISLYYNHGITGYTSSIRMREKKSKGSQRPIKSVAVFLYAHARRDPSPAYPAKFFAYIVSIMVKIMQKFHLGGRGSLSPALIPPRPRHSGDMCAGKAGFCVCGGRAHRAVIWMQDFVAD